MYCLKILTTIKNNVIIQLLAFSYFFSLDVRPTRNYIGVALHMFETFGFLVLVHFNFMSFSMILYLIIIFKFTGI